VSKLDTVRWGVIGLGYFGEVHAHTLSTMPGIQLAALCTRREDRLRQVAESYRVPKRYTDYRQLLADPAIDAISLTTNVDDHRDITVEALRSGKHVLVEKPMAPTVADCDQMIEASRETGRLLMVGHICRFDPRVALAKRAIDDGRLGEILSMNARRNLSKAIGMLAGEKVSALFGHGIHDGDMMLWFNQSNPVSVYAQESHPSTAKYPDCGWAMVRFANGAVGVIEEIWYLPETTRFDIDARMEVIGAQGALYVNCGETGLEIHDAHRLSQPDTAYWPRLFDQRVGALQSELYYFADCVVQGRAPDRCPPEDSRAAVALMAAAEQSSKTGRVVCLEPSRG
jgi:UDP-N-acetylglucosamine 3-dehydrogenase